MFFPILTRDGSTVAYTRRYPQGHLTVFVQALDAGAPAPVCQDCGLTPGVGGRTGKRSSCKIDALFGG